MSQGWLLGAALVGVVLLAIWQGTTNLRLNRALRHYRSLARGAEGQPLDQLLQRVLDRHDLEAATLRELEARVEALGAASEGHLQNVGIVRYNAFDDTGGDQSFAIALLDNRGAGAVFNGLFHRTVCRVYAKPVQEWKSTYSLSDEELEAIRKARAGAGAAG